MGAPFFYVPEQLKTVDATAGPVTTNGGVTSDYVSLKNITFAWMLIQLTQAVGHATVISVRQASAVDGTGAKAGPTSLIWLNEDTVATDTLVKQTSAASVTVTNNVKKKMILIGVDPASLDIANGFDVLAFTVSDSSQATNFVCGSFLLQTKYAQATPPAAITD